MWTAPIVVSDLLTHTCGLTNEMHDTPVAALYRDAGLHNDPTRSLSTFVDDLSELPLAFQPGVRWHYGAGLDVAARLIEVIADQPLGAFLEERIFAPLGMADTAFGVPDVKLDRLAAMYGLPDVFAEGLSLEAVAQAAAAGVNERLDVSGTYPTDTPDVFAREVSGCTPRSATTCASRRCSSTVVSSTATVCSPMTRWR